MGDIAGPDPNEPKNPCKICGRSFAVSSLSRHEGVCRKAANKKRKVFDSGKQRSAGSDIPLQSVKKVQQEIKQNKGHFKPPSTHWREKHDAFISAVKAAKGVDYALKTGAPLPPPPKAVVPSDYVQCQFCGRNFSKAAADRHIPFCKDQKMRSENKPINNHIKKPMTTAPKPATKKATTTTTTAPVKAVENTKSLAPKSATTQVKSAGSQRSVSPKPMRSANANQTRIPTGSAKTTTSMVPVPTSRRNPSPARTLPGGKASAKK